MLSPCFVRRLQLCSVRTTEHYLRSLGRAAKCTFPDFPYAKSPDPTLPVLTPTFAHYCFYKGKPATKSIFAAFILTKNDVKIRMRTDPIAFKDNKELVKDKIYKGWFFK